MLHGAIAASITGDALDRLTASVGDLLPTLVGTDENGWTCLPAVDDLLDGGIALPLALGPFVADVGIRDLALCLDLAELAVELVPDTSPAALRLSVSHARLAFAQPAVVHGSVDLLLANPDAACVIDNQLGLDDIPHAAEVSFQVLATLDVDEDAAFTLTTQTESLEVHDVGTTIETDCSQPECSDPNPGGACLECGVCDPANFGTDLAEFLNELFGQAFDPIVALVLDAVSQPLLDELLNGRPLDVSAEISISNTLGALTESARTAADLGLLVRPAADGFSVQGESAARRLDLRFEGGTAPVSLHPCVGELGEDPVFEPGPWPTFDDPLAGDTPWSIALGISEAFVNQAIWSLYESGALCLAPTTRELADLTGGLVALNAGLLDLVVPGIARMAGRSASIRIRILPRLSAADFPVVVVGPPDSEATIRLALPHLDVALEAWIDHDWVQLLALSAGVEADLAMTLAGTNAELVVDRVSVLDVTTAPGSLIAAARPEEIVTLAMEAIVQVLQSGPFALSLDLSGLTAALGDVPLAIEALRIGPTGPASDWLGVWLDVGEVVR